MKEYVEIDMERKSVAYNTAVQIFGKVFGLVLGLVTLNYVANHLSIDGSTVKGFGQYSIVFAFTSIIGATADLGLFTILVREITTTPNEQAGKLIGNALGFRLLLMIATFLLVALALPVLPYAFTVKQAILIGVLIAFTMLLSQALAALFQAHMLTSKIVLAETIGRLVIIALTIAVLMQGAGLLAVVAVNLVGNLVILLMSLRLAARLTPIRVHFDFSKWKETAPEFWAIAALTVLGLIHFKVDSLMLSWFRPEAEVGIYAIAYKLIEITLILPAVIATNLLPSLSTAHRNLDTSTVVRIGRNGLTATMLSAGFVILILVLLAPWLIVFIANGAFVAAALPLHILIPALFCIFLSTILAQIVISIGRQRRLIAGYLIAVLINIVLNLIFIPMYSYQGAAVVTVITEFLMLAYTLWVVSTELASRVVHWGHLLRLTIAGALTFALFWFVRDALLFPVEQFEVAGKLTQLTQLVFSLAIVGLVFGVFTLALFGGWRRFEQALGLQQSHG